MQSLLIHADQVSWIRLVIQVFFSDVDYIIKTILIPKLLIKGKGWFNDYLLDDLFFTGFSSWFICQMIAKLQIYIIPSHSMCFKFWFG